MKDSYGIVNSSFSSPIIQRNIIMGGKGSRFSNGIYNTFQDSPTIRYNYIHGGSQSKHSYGILNHNRSNSKIQSNTIDGGNGIDISTGLVLYGGSPKIQNNTINGGNGGDISIGIDIFNFSPELDFSPTIENNIVFTSGDGIIRYCITEDPGFSEPNSLRNNNLFECPRALYNDPNGNNLTDINDVNALSYIEASGNVSVDPAFSYQPGGDWHLTPVSPPEVTQGGLDFSATFSKDKDDKARTVPWSIGAYEQD